MIAARLAGWGMERRPERAVKLAAGDEWAFAL